MVVKEIVYAPMAAEQLIYKFNKEYKTHIKHIETDYMDGTPFVTIDLRDTPPDLIFKFALGLGRIQKHLAIKGEELLPLEEYPFPLKRGG